MKITLSLVIILFLVLSPITLAKSNTISATVDGMVCQMCAQGLKQKIEKHKSVQQLDVDFKTSTIKVSLKSKKSLRNTELKKLVEEAGYSVAKNSIKRN